jgi:peptide/nickel transport system ATP-binding protein
MHPYTRALMSAVPIPDPRRKGAKSERILLQGDVPSPIAPPPGCRFHTRCWKATDVCKTVEPPLLELRPGQRVACHHPENAEGVTVPSARQSVEVSGAVAKAESTPVALGKAEAPAETESVEAAEAPEAEGEAPEAEGDAPPKA